MKRTWIMLGLVVTLATRATAGEPAALATQKQKVSYSIGMDMGKGLRQQGIEVDVAALVKGLTDAIAGGKPLMSEQEVGATLDAFQREMTQKQAAAGQKTAEAFLAENKKKEGVVTLPSGLQYKILKAGAGKKPTAADTVECHYRGTLIDGKEFDSSYRRGQPATFPVSRVIPGWTEALKLMPVGSKWQLFVPANLAYGDHGAPPDIGPGATLIFEVELLGIK
jgi:UDP-GlcNAc:undecaprenyl-phosphate/decaprenyl-phosphate GlcNAc-1-phosphate transferase